MVSDYKPAEGNAPGNWFIDSRCINCGASRHVAQGLIVERSGQSVFHHQPETESEVRMANLAREICPTRSVHTRLKDEVEVDLYPVELSKGVFLCGHNARSSFGAHSYLILRDDGNLLFDSPVFTKKLAKAFGKFGPIKRIVLSHRDDVADVDEWATYFSADVYIHEKDRMAAPHATKIIHGSTAEDTTLIAPGLRIIPLPGHTEGSMALLIDNTKLFTGDSLCWLHDMRTLHAFRSACWYSWESQKSSLATLAKYDFRQIFAGHGSWSPDMEPEVMRELLLNLVAGM